MEFTDDIIILLRRHFRESDRMVSAYSRLRGRLNLRFPGVNKSASKLKAFSEPFSKSSARVYIKNNASVGCVTGGKLADVYANIRKNYAKTELALHFCDLFYRLTPPEQPNADKFELLDDSLKQIDEGEIHCGFAPAFLLRLMQLSGFGLRAMPVMGVREDYWETLHRAPLCNLAPRGEKDLENLNKVRYVCRRFLNAQLNYPLRTISHLDTDLPVNFAEIFTETALEPAFEPAAV
jgi:DNA repair protein RecO (recombination protein O)